VYVTTEKEIVCHTDIIKINHFYIILNVVLLVS